MFSLVPVVDTANERREQVYAGFFSGADLGEGEQQSQVGVNTFFFQLFGGVDAFPGGRQLIRMRDLSIPCCGYMPISLLAAVCDHCGQLFKCGLGYFPHSEDHVRTGAVCGYVALVSDHGRWDGVAVVALAE